jgi:hypothetical protein
VGLGRGWRLNSMSILIMIFTRSQRLGHDEWREGYSHDAKGSVMSMDVWFDIFLEPKARWCQGRCRFDEDEGVGIRCR